MRFRQLKSFIAVCEAGSISKAAEQLHVAQPALGLQIRGLEDEMGAQLLERNPRGVQLTPAGAIVLAWAQQTFKDMHEAKAQIRAQSDSAAATLQLGLTPTIASAFAVTVLDAVHKELTRVRLHLVEGLGHVLHEWVRAGRVDCALIFDALADGAPSHDALLSEELYFVAPPDTTALGEAGITLEELFEFPLVLPGNDDSIRRVIEAAAHASGLSVKPEYQVQSVGVTLSLVAAGFACSVLPLTVIDAAVNEGRVVSRRIVLPSLQRQLRWAVSPAVQDMSLVRDVQRVVESTLRTGCAVSPWREAYTFADAQR